jgi:hypothetical protein
MIIEQPKKKFTNVGSSSLSVVGPQTGVGRKPACLWIPKTNRPIDARYTFDVRILAALHDAILLGWACSPKNNKSNQLF